MNSKPKIKPTGTRGNSAHGQAYWRLDVDMRGASGRWSSEFS